MTDNRQSVLYAYLGSVCQGVIRVDHDHFCLVQQARVLKPPSAVLTESSNGPQ
jgi:hypothetical protein